MAVCRTGEKFTKYAVLGDDVVIADQEVARVYEQSLDQLRVPLFKNPKFPIKVQLSLQRNLGSMNVEWTLLSRVSMKTLNNWYHPYGF